MRFEGFTPQMLDLLMENHLNNSKPWYEEHKPEIRRLVIEPFYALIEQMTPTMTAIDPLFVTQPSRCLSRVRRDTRYTKNKDLYRDHMWVTFRHARKSLGSALCYYFEIEQDSWGYGVGYYQIPTDTLDEMRQMILHEDKWFLEAFRAVDEGVFSLYGEQYKRNHFPDAPEQYQTWLNRRHIGVSFSSNEFQALFDGAFYDKMIADIRQIQPFYQFLQKAEERAGSNRSTGGIG